MEKNTHFFGVFFIFFCSYALISCDTLNNGIFEENDLFSINNQKTIKLSDNRFIGVFQRENEWSYNYISYKFTNIYKFNGTNIIEEYISHTSSDNVINLSFSNRYEFEVKDKKYRYRYLSDYWYIGEWTNWLDYDFSNDCNILTLQFEMDLELLEKYPYHEQFYYSDYEKIK